MIAQFPWPPVTLWPNNRAHRMVNAKATRHSRNTCGIIALAAGLRRTTAETVALTVTFHPPRKPGRMNIDGCISACKPAVDAIADVMHVDDSRFRITWPLTFSEPVKGGAVVVEVAA